MSLWRCPACRAEESLVVGRVKTGFLGSKPTVRCISCGAEWTDLSGTDMTMIRGPSELLGTKSLDEWWTVSGAGYIDLDAPVKIDTNVLFGKDERALLWADAVSQLKEKTTRARSGGGAYSGVSIPLFRTGSGAVRWHLGGIRTPAKYTEGTEIVTADQGELLLTNQMVLFQSV